MNTVKEFMMLFSLFLLFSILNDYSPGLYHLLQSIIIIVPLMLFVSYRLIRWIYYYVKIKLRTR